MIRLRITLVTSLLGILCLKCQGSDFSNQPQQKMEVPVASPTIVSIDSKDDESLSEAITIPQVITGAYIACRQLQQPSEPDLKAHVGCWLGDENGQKIRPSENLALVWFAELPENLTSPVTLRQEQYAGENLLWDVSYYLSADNLVNLQQGLASLVIGASIKDQNGLELGVIKEPLAQALSRDPIIQVMAFKVYRIAVTEMQAACQNNTVGIEGLGLVWDNALQPASFASLPETNDPAANVGSIGGLQVRLSSSGSFAGFYPYEIFGGGFGGGWWAAENSFNQNTPAQAVTDVWFQVEFLENDGVLLDKLVIDGGSTNDFGTPNVDFNQCAPSKMRVKASQNGRDFEILLDLNVDTRNSVEIKL